MLKKIILLSSFLVIAGTIALTQTIVVEETPSQVIFSPAELQLIVEELMVAKRKRLKMMALQQVGQATSGDQSLATLLDNQTNREEIKDLHILLVEINERLKRLEGKEKESLAVAEPSIRLPTNSMDEGALQYLKQQLQRELGDIKRGLYELNGEAQLPKGLSAAAQKAFWQEQAAQLLRISTHIEQLDNKFQDLANKEDYTALKEQISQLEFKLNQSHTGDDNTLLTQLKELHSTLDGLEKGQLQIKEQLNQPDSVYAQLQNLIAGKEKMQLFFDLNSHQLKEEAKTGIQSIIGITATKERFNFLVIGYTDNKGSATYNKELSLLRADEVKKYLVQQGIHPSRIVTQSHGRDMTVTDPDKARRVDLMTVIRRR